MFNARHGTRHMVGCRTGVRLWALDPRTQALCSPLTVRMLHGFSQVLSIRVCPLLELCSWSPESPWEVAGVSYGKRTSGEDTQTNSNLPSHLAEAADTILDVSTLLSSTRTTDGPLSWTQPTYKTLRDKKMLSFCKHIFWWLVTVSSQKPAAVFQVVIIHYLKFLFSTSTTKTS